MNASLIIIQEGAAVEGWRPLVKDARQHSELLLLSNDEATDQAARAEDLDFINIRNRFPLRGARDAQVTREAIGLFLRLAKVVDNSSEESSLRLGHESIIQIQRLVIELFTLCELLKTVATIREILAQKPVSSIYVIYRHRGFSEFIGQLLESLNPEYTIHLLAAKPRSTLNWRGRIVRGLGAVYDLEGVALLIRALRKFPLRSQSRRLAPSLGLSALFATDARPLYYQSLEPVLREMPEEIDARAMVDVELQSTPASSNLPIVEIHPDRLSLRNWGRVMKRWRALKRAWRRLERRKEFVQAFTYEGLNLWPGAKAKIRHAIYFRSLILLTQAAQIEEIIRQTKPRVLVTSGAPLPFVRLAISLARQHGIPALDVQSALINDHPINRLCVADRIAVLDECTARIFDSHEPTGLKREANPAVIVGLPRWDAIVERVRAADAISIRRELGAVAADRLLVFATQPLEHEHLCVMLRALAAAIGRVENGRLVVKCHPSENREKYLMMLAELGIPEHEILVLEKCDLYGLIAACDLLATSYSNVAMEAAIAGKAVLTMNLTGEPDIISFADRGLAVAARNEEEITAHAIELLTGTAARERLGQRREEYFQRNPQVRDGRAAQRVLDLLREMVADNPGPEQ